MVSAPWLGAVGRTCVTFRKVGCGLKYNLYRDMTFIFSENFLTEVLFEVFADHKHDLAESGFDSVVDRIVHDSLTGRAERVELLKTSVAAAHSGCQHKECRFHRWLIAILIVNLQALKLKTIVSSNTSPSRSTVKGKF